MPKNIRLSGAIREKDSQELREIRAKLLYHLFSEGYNIYNGNGDQDVTLWNIQKKIIEADGFVFLPGAHLDDIVKASSIFVGYQTGDKDLDGKPSVLLNQKGSWDMWLNLIDHLHDLGTVSQKREQIINIVKKTEDVVSALRKQQVTIEKKQTKYAKKPPKKSIKGDESRKKPNYSICVFCSASTTDDKLIQMGYDLGRDIAKAGWGCISGAGRTGIMGSVVRGAYEGGGWTGGSNIPHIIQLEGLPDGMNAFWPTGDIYQRMQIMIEKSDAFVILPGGMGSVQEALVLLDLKRKRDPLMKSKKIVVVNPSAVNKNGKKVRFWDPLIKLAERHRVTQHLTITNTIENVTQLLRPGR